MPMPALAQDSVLSFVQLIEVKVSQFTFIFFVALAKIPYKKYVVFLNLRFLDFFHLRLKNLVTTPFWSLHLWFACTDL
jgi:hypothetical protein